MLITPTEQEKKVLQDADVSPFRRAGGRRPQVSIHLKSNSNRLASPVITSALYSSRRHKEQQIHAASIHQQQQEQYSSKEVRKRLFQVYVHLPSLFRLASNQQEISPSGIVESTFWPDRLLWILGVREHEGREERAFHHGLPFP